MSENDEIPMNTSIDHATLKSYVIGYVLSTITTVLAFWIVMYDPMPASATYVWLTLLAILQLYVQLVFFLHMNTRSDGQWNLMSFIFTLVVVLVLVFGSLWIMINLNYNMMN